MVVIDRLRFTGCQHARMKFDEKLEDIPHYKKVPGM